MKLATSQTACLGSVALKLATSQTAGYLADGMSEISPKTADTGRRTGDPNKILRFLVLQYQLLLSNFLLGFREMVFMSKRGSKMKAK